MHPLVSLTTKTEEVEMCGIAGLMLTRPGPIGAYLTDMIAAEQHRGPDSTGFALYGDKVDGYRMYGRIRVAAEASAVVEEVEEVVRRLGGWVERGSNVEGASDGGSDSFFSVQFSGITDTRELLREVEKDSRVEVNSIGESLVLIKDVGDAHQVARRHGLREFQGTHGLAHCRLATETLVDVAHSHPFWGRASTDVSVVHNGQITNYWRLRDILVGRGYDFATDNDSELIAVYIAAKLSAGVSLDDALRESVDAFDGSFTYLVATPDGIGMAKDVLAAKPFVLAERDGVIAMASEEGALTPVFGATFDAILPAEGEVMTWWKSTLKA